MMLYCNECYNVIKQLPDKSIDLIYTDAPYDIAGNNSSAGCFGEKKRDYHAEYNKVSNNKNVSALAKRQASSSSSSIAEIAFGFDYNLLDEFVRVMKNIYIYIWCSKMQIPKLLDYFVTQHNCFFEVLCWCKTNPIPACSSKYLSDVEYCLLFREKGTKIYGEYATKHKYYVSPLNVEDKKLYGHPTIKPLCVVKNHIYNSLDTTRDNSNFVVLDPFMGSGTTGVACKELGVDFIGIELNEEYFETAKNRIENHIYKKPTEKQKALQQSIFDILGDKYD